MKFVHKIAAASSALLLVTVGLLNTTQYLNVKSELNNTIEESITDIVQGVANTVSSELDGKKTMVGYIASVVSDNPDKDYITQIISQKDAKDAFLLIGGGFDATGVSFKNDPNWDPGANWDPRQRPWYKESKAQNDLIITEPYADAASGKILVSIATPIMKDRQFFGSIFFDVSLSNLSDLVNSVNLFDAGYLFIVTENGVVIAHPESKYNGKGMNTFLPNSRIDPNTMTNVTLDNIEYNLRFTKVPSQDWYVAVLIDEKIAYQSIYNMRDNAIIYSIVALIISILTLLFLMRRLLVPLDELNNAIQDVASGNGDLTKRLNTKTDQEFAELATGFNTFTANLQNQVKQLKTYGVEILNGAVVMSSSSVQSAEAMDVQLQEIELLATAMNEMATTAADVASNAQNAATAAQEAEDATTLGSEVVHTTTTSIDVLSTRIETAVKDVVVLEEATSNIATVLQVINDIADQTNLLALNAAIEAARAGEQGRGFAVVADEVRTLALRTQESTTEIRTLIDKLQSGATAVSLAMNASQEAAQGTVEQAKKTGNALDQIYDAIKRINDMNIQIASAAEEQSLVAEEINSNTVKIKDLSVQVSEAAQETNRATEEQTRSVRDQNVILDKFIV
ncbi:methyl-accepting chemotaxis protein [Colwellia sp. Arc7-635]|uniref:methyl-accepting chemotaxis protein n=1 Tax=Colwellia sp. Arc7-635 TaxID=2497879 RepID=UPI000F854392|nr:methyl-accepting chemotaxis protein [Colwellia sp. Arc7-635]AZQ84326.1 methyl-accepting chemotaxis protein [Colwellia sp. Arc7-635]